MSTGKTVYILGAGASASAKLPTQAGLLPLIFTISRETFADSEIGTGFLELNLNDKAHRIQDFYPKFDAYRRSLGQFIVTNFSSAEKAKQYSFAIEQANAIEEASAEASATKDFYLKKAYNIAKAVNVTLEDLFTIFDSVDAGREHFRLYSPTKMMRIHNQLKMCIIYALSFSIAIDCDASDYNEFAKLLLEKRLASTQKSDDLSIITMNWDDVLERSLYDLCEEYNTALAGHRQRIYPDLCFYNYDLSNSNKHIPSTQIKARGHKNIKILKMHGSLAWLECPKCGRIFTDFQDEIASEEFADTECPFCKSNEYDTGDVPILRSLIITPTFMKSLDNLNLKNIWHNAYIDISEADHLVFIGYSFPDADFEMRCLLKKATKSTADVTVVLTQSSNPQRLMSELVHKGCTENEARDFIKMMSLPSERYISFFGEDKVTLLYDGFREYLGTIGGSKCRRKK